MFEIGSRPRELNVMQEKKNPREPLAVSSRISRNRLSDFQPIKRRNGTDE